MKNKLLGLWIFFLSLNVQTLYAQKYQLELKEGDKYFSKKEYTRALEIYENLYESSGMYSLSMLLKMALIHEIAGDYSKTLFYLNIYYRDQPNKKILDQMEYLAEKHDLSGYKYTDLEYFISLYNEYYYYIIVYVLACAGIFLIYLSLKKMRKQKLGIRPILFFVILCFIYYITNYRVVPPRAIIAHKNTVLMSAPSAASEMVGLAGEGHRVTIRNKQDIWYEINWSGKSAFIREGDLYLIPQNQQSLF